MSAVLARPGFLGEVRRGDLATKRMRTQSSVGFGETYLQVQEFGQSYVLYSCWSKGNVGTHFEKTRGARIRSRFRSISAHDEQKKTQAHVNWTLCEDPENPTFVLTHTNEEAQVFVHDLNFFVTVQLLEDALAVLSLGKLCIDHGYSYEWVSGHKPRLTKEGKTIVCKTDTFVGLVVPGLFTSSGSNSSSTPGIVNKISPWAKWRTSPTKVVRIILKSHKVEMRTTVCEIFLNGWRSSQIILRTQKCLHPHTISQDSDSERPTKVTSKSRKHSIYTHFRKDRNCDVCFQTKMTRAPCRRRTGEALPRTKKFGDLMAADGQGDGSPRQRQVSNRRTREGPKPACVQTPLSPGWHTQGGEGRIDVLPWYCLVGVVSTSSGTHKRSFMRRFTGVRITLLRHFIDLRQVASLKSRPTSKGGQIL